MTGRDGEIRERCRLFELHDPSSYVITCHARGIDPGDSAQISAKRPDIDLSGHDARIRIAGSSGSYEEYRLLCEAEGVEPKTPSGWTVDRKVFDMFCDESEEENR